MKLLNGNFAENWKSTRARCYAESSGLLMNFFQVKVELETLTSHAYEAVAENSELFSS